MYSCAVTCYCILQFILRICQTVFISVLCRKDNCIGNYIDEGKDVYACTVNYKSLHILFNEEAHQTKII